MENFQMSLTMAASLAAAFAIFILVFLRMPDRMADHRIALGPVIQNISLWLIRGASYVLFVAIIEAVNVYRDWDSQYEIYVDLVLLVLFGYLMIAFAARVFQMIMTALTDPPHPPASNAVRARLRNRQERR